MKLRGVLLLASVVFIAVPSMASAISDVLTVCNPNGRCRSVIATDDQEAKHGGILKIFPGIAIDPAQVGNDTTLCETLPCDPNSDQSVFSDLFGIVFVRGRLHLGFISDDETGVLAGNLGARFLLEIPGLAYDATMYLSPGLRARGFTATFASDGDVPEPGSLILLGSGLLGVVGLMRRKLML